MLKNYLSIVDDQLFLSDHFPTSDYYKYSCCERFLQTRVQFFWCIRESAIAGLLLSIFIFAAALKRAEFFSKWF